MALTPAEKMRNLRERRKKSGMCVVCGQRKARKARVTCKPCSERAKKIILIERSDWNAVGELILASAERLRGAGANFLISPDNTIHQALPRIQDRLPLPWLHIGDAVVEAAPG
jgi:aspartate/glutamate racemase